MLFAFLANMAGLTANGLLVFGHEDQNRVSAMLWVAGGFAGINLALAVLFGTAFCYAWKNRKLLVLIEKQEEVNK